MKNKTISAICTIMMLVPWTILPLRSFPWALKTPVAQITISCYAAFMIFSGVFTILAYHKRRLKSTWMQVCAVVNGIYSAAGAMVFLLMILGFFSFD